MVSAPLQYKVRRPSGLRTITDILLRSLLKSNMANKSYTLVSPISTAVMVSGVRERKTKPKFLAAVTSAPSSGDCA